jgi:hypothetical protein
MLLAVVAGALVLPAAAPTAPLAQLTLHGPGKTTFNHRIDFVGRMTPAQRGSRVVLVRGTDFVTAGKIRRDGSFRLQVRIGSPGPFHAVAGGIRSNDVTVKIVPRLDTSLVGPAVVGTPLKFVAKVEPRQAGPLRIRVVRPGRRSS